MYDIMYYYEASTVGEAIAFLKKNPKARIVSRESDVFIKKRNGETTGRVLLSIGRIPELQRISVKENGDLEIGTAITLSSLLRETLICYKISYLKKVAGQTGRPKWKKTGSIGNAFCAGIIGTEVVRACGSLGVKLKIAGEHGTRVLPVKDFYSVSVKPVLKPGELLTYIIVPKRQSPSLSVIK